jgi:signal transduction histidine kinase
MLRNIPIRKKLLLFIFLTNGIVLFLTCSIFFIYELITFRDSSLEQLSTLGKIISENSTAALAFDDREGATDILLALKAEPHIESAGLYNKSGILFAKFPPGISSATLPPSPGKTGFQFNYSFLHGFQRVEQGNNFLGTLYLNSNNEVMYERFRLYGALAALVIMFSFLLAYLISRKLQSGIANPILALANTADIISKQKDYSVRAQKISTDEMGLLTDAFNQMLTQIEEQNRKITYFNQRLEQKVQERTHELEIANKELEAFSYSVSHDLRAPLRHIDAYTTILSNKHSERLDDDAKKYMRNIINNSKKMNQLIDDLLSFSQLGKKDIQKADFSMKELVFEVWNELNKMEDSRQIKFIVGELPNAHADRVIIKQVWENLISNAIKYTRFEKSPVIEIGSEDKVDSIIYHIKDNGAGFNMSYYNNLFTAFQRLHNQNEFEGTGVGLAIVERIIIRHGGRIWAHGIPGEGAEFYFSLPKQSPLNN